MNIDELEKKREGRMPENPIRQWTKDELAIIQRMVQHGAQAPTGPRVSMKGAAILPAGPKSVVDMLLEDRGESP